MRLDRFSLGRAADALVAGLPGEKGTAVYGGREVTVPSHAFVIRDLIVAAAPELESRAHTPEGAIEALVYLLSVTTTDAERPPGFGSKSLSARVIAPSIPSGAAEVMMVVNHRVWCGPITVHERIAGEHPHTESPAKVRGELETFVREIEALANRAVRDVRALERFPPQPTSCRGRPHPARCAPLDRAALLPQYGAGLRPPRPRVLIGSGSAGTAPWSSRWRGRRAVRLACPKTSGGSSTATPRLPGLYPRRAARACDAAGRIPRRVAQS